MQECDSMRMNLDLKEKELSAWEEKLNAREKVYSCTFSFSEYFFPGNFGDGQQINLCKFQNLIYL